MAPQGIQQSLVVEVYRNLCSYPVAAKIAVLGGCLEGLGRAMAQACVMARMAHIVLVDANELHLCNAKAQLESLATELHAKTTIHVYAARNREPDSIASIFFDIRATLGIPDLLLLGQGRRYISGSILECTVDDISRWFDLDETNRNSFLQNFLAPGTKKRKSIITLAVVGTVEDMAGKPNTIAHFLAHARTHDGGTWFSVHELGHGLVSEEVFEGSLTAGSSLSGDGEFHLNRDGPAHTRRTVDVAGRCGVLLVSEETAWLFNTTVVGEEPVEEEAQVGERPRNGARLVTIATRGGITDT